MIRDFNRTDTLDVLAMVDELRAESPLHRGLPFDADHVALIMNSFTVRGWVADGSAGLRGYCFATMVPSLLGPGRLCTDLSVFVRKPFRNGTIASRFVRAMVEWGEAQGALAHQHVVSTGNPGIERLYERYGFVRTGGAFMMASPTRS